MSQAPTNPPPLDQEPSPGSLDPIDIDNDEGTPKRPPTDTKTN